MRRESNGVVIWLTGLSAAGKTTLASALVLRLRQLGFSVKWLDGDQVRRGANRDLGYSREDRDENVRRIGRSAGALAQQGFTVVVSAGAPFRSVRDEVRKSIPRFIEVYVCAPLDVCEARDPKGLYRRARAGDLSNVPGIDLPYEPPLAPDVECRTDTDSIDACQAKILNFVLYRTEGGASQPSSSRSISVESFRTSSR